MVWIEREKSVRQSLALALRSGYSRIPVIGENVDDTVGVVYLKDLVRFTTARANDPGGAGRPPGSRRRDHAPGRLRA